MIIKFSPLTLGFYFEGIHSQVPNDAIIVSEEEYKAALTFQSQGLELYAGANGKPASRAVTLDPEQLRKSFIVTLQTFMDSKAQERGYDDIKSAALRAALPNSPFHDEGVAYGEWMDECWMIGYQLLAMVEAGAPVPTKEEVVSAMPELVLPTRDVS